MTNEWDNEFTRKEVICPLIGEYCNREEKNCGICIAEQEEWEKQQDYENHMERMLWEEEMHRLTDE